MTEKRMLIAGTTVGEAALEEAYNHCKPRAAECNGVLILMQKKEGGILWEAPANMELRDLVFLINGFAYRLSQMASSGDRS